MKGQGGLRVQMTIHHILSEAFMLGKMTYDDI